MGHVMMTVVQVMWQEQNGRIFNHRVVSILHLLDFILYYVNIWAGQFSLLLKRKIDTSILTYACKRMRNAVMWESLLLLFYQLSLLYNLWYLRLKDVVLVWGQWRLYVGELSYMLIYNSDFRLLHRNTHMRKKYMGCQP